MQYQIETTVGTWLVSQGYQKAVEVGFGGKTVAAELLRDSGIPVLCTDIHEYPNSPVPSVVDDCIEPDFSLYEGADLIYTIRPGIEIVPALIRLAEMVNADLIIYHLGFEVYLDGGERIPTAGLVLHRYVRRR